MGESKNKKSKTIPLEEMFEKLFIMIDGKEYEIPKDKHVGIAFQKKDGGYESKMMRPEMIYFRTMMNSQIPKRSE